MKVNLLIAQFRVLLNIAENLNQILEIISNSEEEDLIILPEGALSGYADDMTFLNYIDSKDLHSALKLIKDKVYHKKVHIIFGCCIKQSGKWYNTAIGYSYSNKDFIYRKVNLAIHEREIITPGDQLPVVNFFYKGQEMKLGVQLCREIRFPEQWKYLSIKGAQVFVYLTYTLGNEINVWRSHLISRAAENQRFLISCNVAAKEQQCPTMLISPKGEIIQEVISEDKKIIKASIDLTEVSNWYLSQNREDIVKICSPTLLEINQITP